MIVKKEDPYNKDFEKSITNCPTSNTRKSIVRQLLGHEHKQELTLDQSYPIEATVDELYLCLAKQRSYSKQAFDLIHKIPIDRPTPVFIIKIVDLNQQVKKELDDRWKYKQEIDYIVKEAVSRIFENINERYFLLSVNRLLRVALVS